MRSDMAKILVDRPRWGSRMKNWTCRSDRARARDGDLEALPKRRAMRPRHGYGKDLNENLAPLIRFLRSRCGKPWNAVYRELRDGLDVRSPIQLHIFEHLEDFVAVHPRWQDGVLYNTNPRFGGWQRLRRNGRQFYVDPRSGLLAEVPAERPARPRETPNLRQIDERTYVRFRGTWNEVRLSILTWRRSWETTIDYTGLDRVDVLLKAQVSRENEAERIALYGLPEYASRWRRPLGRKTLKQLGLWRT